MKSSICDVNLINRKVRLRNKIDEVDNCDIELGDIAEIVMVEHDVFTFVHLKFESLFHTLCLEKNYMLRNFEILEDHCIEHKNYCDHSFKLYEGFMESYYYCTKCDLKKPLS